MELFSPEQMEVLMLVAGADDPLDTAVQVRRRWAYILGVAKAAQQGFLLDTGLPQVMEECDTYAVRAEKVVAALDEWLADRQA
ncbi:MAG TPA: hypothetical protein VGK74_16375 [Symbiobacteriaceae bacterium]|jgi:hypothetical protein